MAEVALAHDAVIIAMLGPGDQVLGEIDMVVFFSRVGIVIAATPRCHFNQLSPWNGAAPPSTVEKQGQTCGRLTHMSCREVLGLVKPILKECLARL